MSEAINSMRRFIDNIEDLNSEMCREMLKGHLKDAYDLGYIDGRIFEMERGVERTKQLLEKYNGKLD